MSGSGRWTRIWRPRETVSRLRVRRSLCPSRTENWRSCRLPAACLVQRSCGIHSMCRGMPRHRGRARLASPRFGVWRAWRDLEPQAKGQDIALQVLSQEKWRTRPVQLTFYGSGPQEQGLKALVEMLGLEAKVHFAGHVSDVQAIWGRNHALLLPSRYEGLPLALVEAMLCNRVPIVTAVAGNPDVVCDGVSGFLAEAPTVRHLDEAMERAWDQRTNWQAMGEVAGERIRQLVPQDPAADFAARLLTLAGKL
jgi:glycosyltransferase involved in cell wall biosynthesis